jgi:hypothetical protein
MATITNITVNNDDGTTQVFTPQVTAPVIPTITVPLNTPVEIVAQ